jgi:hypothetical protein
MGFYTLKHALLLMMNSFFLCAKRIIQHYKKKSGFLVLLNRTGIQEIDKLIHYTYCEEFMSSSSPRILFCHQQL